jgi:3-hydroxyacyl-CoA dehydrogenase
MKRFPVRKVAVLGAGVMGAQIAAHLAATRGLLADPGCIVITAGTQQALRTAALANDDTALRAVLAQCVPGFPAPGLA